MRLNFISYVHAICPFLFELFVYYYQLFWADFRQVIIFIFALLSIFAFYLIILYAF